MTPPKYSKYPKLVKIPGELFMNKPNLSKSQIEELIAGMRSAVEKMRPLVLKQAYDSGILVSEEYESRYKGHFYDEFGCDSFIQYLHAAMNLNEKEDYFLTMNEQILSRRDELTARFWLKIASPEEMMAMMEKEKKDYDA